MNARAVSLVLSLTIAATAVVLPGVSSASHQAAKNGCTSAAPVAGTLLSPEFQVGGTQVQLNLWWEIESVAPNSRDQLHIDVFDPFQNGGSFVELDGSPLNPAQTNPGSGPHVPLSNAGLQQPPAWTPQTLGFGVNRNATRLRFRFVSGGTQHNGFRGWGIDDVVVTDGSLPTFSEPFDATPSGWTMSGMWRHLPDTTPVFMSSAINPPLVTLASGDDGRVPPDPDGEGIAWFGEPSTGTYCGADALTEPPAPNLAPSAAFNVSPAAPRTSDTVSFDGSPSTDPEGALSSHTWDFGDGTSPATGPTASHVYAQKGSYTVSLTVTDALGATSTATHVLQVESNLGTRIVVADKLDDLDNPSPFREVNVEPTEGEVFVDLPGGAGAAQVPGAPRGFIPLTQAAQLPIGTILETSRGKVMVESARDRRGRRTQRAEFFDGRFQMRQPRVRRGAPITEMVLKGGGFRSCPRARQSASWSRANDAQRRRRNSRVRRLWGNGRGRFRTRGRYSSATVRGTKWLVEDRCNGTLTRLARRPRTSRVDVRDLTRRRTIRLRAGRSYLARPRAARRR